MDAPTDDATWQTRAIEDNVAWCTAVVGAQGCETRLGDDCWSCAEAVPTFYPNLITRRRHAAIEQALNELGGVLTGGFGVKDSFADLDLTPFGFAVIVDARWYLRTAAPWPATETEVAAAGVRVAGTAEDLSAWVDAWGQTPPGVSIFDPRLLEAAGVAFLSVETGAGTAGLVANQTGTVVGISNAFGADAGIAQCLAYLAANRPEAAMVGYGDAAELRFLTEHGFRGLGNLRVWSNA